MDLYDIDYEEDYDSIDEDSSENDDESSDSDSSSDSSSEEESETENNEETIEKDFSFPFITKFEKTRLLGIRTEQILANGKIFIDNKNISDPYEIALEEIKQKKSPLIIRRYLLGKYIDISVNKLILLQ